MARQSVPGTSNGDRNSSISDMCDRRVRRTGSDDVDIDRRRNLISGSQGWKSSSTRYVGAVQLQSLKVMNGELVPNPFWRFQPM